MPFKNQPLYVRKLPGGSPTWGLSCHRGAAKGAGFQSRSPCRGLTHQPRFLGFAFCILTCAYCYHQVAACTALWWSRLSIHPDASTMNAPGVNNVCTYPYGPDSPEIKTFARGNRKNLEHVRSRSGRARGRMAATLPHTAGGFFIILIKNHKTYAVMLQV